MTENRALARILSFGTDVQVTKILFIRRYYEAKKMYTHTHIDIDISTLVPRSGPIEYNSMMYALLFSRLVSIKENWQGSKKKNE